MTTSFYLECGCGAKASSDIEYTGREMWAGFECPTCGRIMIGHIPGEGKYIRPDTLAKEESILDIFQEEKPRLTVRRIYYALTVKNMVPKTEAGYRQTCYLLAKMRRSGALPYGWIADNTRWQRKPTTYRGLAAALGMNQTEVITLAVDRLYRTEIVSPERLGLAESEENPRKTEESN